MERLDSGSCWELKAQSVQQGTSPWGVPLGSSEVPSAKAAGATPSSFKVKRQEVMAKSSGLNPPDAYSRDQTAPKSGAPGTRCTQRCQGATSKLLPSESPKLDFSRSCPRPQT